MNTRLNTRRRNPRIFRRLDATGGTTGSAFHQGMVTLVDRVLYDFTERIGQVAMPPNCCTDMEGAIEFFTRIDPDVLEVQTFAGGALDTVYVRTDTERGSGWNARRPPTLVNYGDARG
jgi:hypothetical protein